jgi:hypothetical protein
MPRKPEESIPGLRAHSTSLLRLEVVWVYDNLTSQWTDCRAAGNIVVLVLNRVISLRCFDRLDCQVQRVATPCWDIAKHPDNMFEHPNKGNYLAMASVAQIRGWGKHDKKL